MKNAIVMLSGGLESSVLVPYALSENTYDRVEAIHVYYGQTNSKEKEAAKRIADYYGIPIMFIDLSKVFDMSDCAMIASNHLDVSVSHEKFKKDDQHFGIKEKTFVPYRNGVFISTGVAIAYSKKYDSVLYGVHALDIEQENAYPDCSRKFVESQAYAIRYGTSGSVELVLPFRNMEKSQILQLGLSKQVPYQLTWSCYTNNETPCGQCCACIERQKAFNNNQTSDPLLQIKQR